MTAPELLTPVAVQGSPFKVGDLIVADTWRCYVLGVGVVSLPQPHSVPLLLAVENPANPKMSLGGPDTPGKRALRDASLRDARAA